MHPLQHMQRSLPAAVSVRRQLAIKQIVFKRKQIQQTNNTLIGYIDHTDSTSFYKSYILLTCTFSLTVADILRGRKLYHYNIIWQIFWKGKKLYCEFPIFQINPFVKSLYIPYSFEKCTGISEIQNDIMIDTIFIQSYWEDKLLKCWLIKHWGGKVHGTEEEKNIW